ncbi:hypothetical protein ANO11243_063110 [Dothideomycetidae sp. 11243]|nr:hypothetical protein ANO11243_063110 [fungal sp. No.11243]
MRVRCGRARYFLPLVNHQTRAQKVEEWKAYVQIDDMLLCCLRVEERWSRLEFLEEEVEIAGLAAATVFNMEDDDFLSLLEEQRMKRIAKFSDLGALVPKLNRFRQIRIAEIALALEE